MKDTPPAVCKDCGVDTAPCTGRRGCRHIGRWEWYIVYDEVWQAAAAGEGFLCIACLQRRLGRLLNRDDFPPYRINLPHPWDSPRLSAALNRQRPLRRRRMVVRVYR